MTSRSAREGRPRPFWSGFVLAVLTLGLYGLYWNLVAHREVHRAFHLAEEGRSDGLAWYLATLVLVVPYVAYANVFVGNVRFARERLGLPPAVSAARFVGLQVAAFVLWLFLTLFGFMFIFGDAAWDPVTGRARPSFVLAFDAFLALGIAALLGLNALAYRPLQGALNELWAARDARAAGP